MLGARPFGDATFTSFHFSEKMMASMMLMWTLLTELCGGSYMLPYCRNLGNPYGRLENQRLSYSALAFKVRFDFRVFMS